MINELLQWAVLTFVGIFVVGLTRQLGFFMTPNREHVAIEHGPELSQQLSFPRGVRDSLGPFRDLIASKSAGYGLVIAVDEFCPGCAGLLERLRQNGSPDGAPVLALVKEESLDFRAEVESDVDLAVFGEDAKRVLDHMRLPVTPFVMIVDEKLRVQHKAVLPDMNAAVARWRGHAVVPIPVAAKEVA